VLQARYGALMTTGVTQQEQPLPGLLVSAPDELVHTVERVVRAGLPVGTPAWGDRAMRLLLEVYEQVLERHPDLPARSLVSEHGGLTYLGAARPGDPVRCTTRTR
jgi:predicted amidohydrolase YtcJ